MKRLLLFISIFFIGISVPLFSNYVFPWQKQTAIETTLIWAGISKFPASNDQIIVTKKGTLFTRQFLLEFETSTENIDRWIKTEIAFKKVSSVEKDNERIYNFHPGKKGSIGGTIRIQNNKVLIKMSWS